MYYLAVQCVSSVLWSASIENVIFAIRKVRADMLDTDGCRYCDRCGVKLTPENNKNGYELCDRCDKQLHEELKADREKRKKESKGC